MLLYEKIIAVFACVCAWSMAGFFSIQAFDKFVDSPVQHGASVALPIVVSPLDLPQFVERTIDTERIDDLFKHVSDLEVRLKVLEKVLESVVSKREGASP